MRNTNQVEDQIFGDNEQKGFLSVRNIAIVGGVTLLALTGLGVLYRNELFSSKPAAVETEKPEADEPAIIVNPGSEEANVITIEQYLLNAQLLPEIEAFKKNSVLNVKNNKTRLNQPKFTLAFKCPENVDVTQFLEKHGGTIDKMEFTTLETLFNAYADAPVVVKWQKVSRSTCSVQT